MTAAEPVQITLPDGISCEVGQRNGKTCHKFYINGKTYIGKTWVLPNGFLAINWKHRHASFRKEDAAVMWLMHS